ncbi:MAG: HypC/HybG/HupF family hydrogenase formation chaperone [Desulfovibrionaceae bacterium]|nr:HypC/HybG/HupF family hydrogenase formation chaperone [Desulfovibrionaceae bacterium]
MCLAIPARIEELKENSMAVVCVEDFTSANAAGVTEGEAASVTRLNISTSLLPEPPQVGDYVMVHAGFAINRMDPEEAEETLLIFRQMAELQGL